jgi:hypothetical protein
VSSLPEQPLPIPVEQPTAEVAAPPAGQPVQANSEPVAASRTEQDVTDQLNAAGSALAEQPVLVPEALPETPDEFDLQEQADILEVSASHGDPVDLEPKFARVAPADEPPASQ